MRKLLIFLLLLIILLGAGILFLPQFIPTEQIKQQIIAQVEKKTGRDLDVTGALQLTLFPRIAVEMNGIAFANARWSKEPLMLKAERATVNLSWLPLLQQKIAIDSVTLTRPVLTLEVAQSGDPNWKMPGLEQQASADAQTATPGATTAAPASAFAISDMMLEQLTIEDGTLIYRNHQNPQTITLETLNAEASLPGMDKTATLDGTALWHGQEVAVELRADAPGALMQGNAQPLKLKATSSAFSLNFEGVAALGEAMEADGSLDASTSSLRSLLAWLGVKASFPSEEGFRKAAIKGTISTDGNNISLRNSSITLDDITAKGDIAADLSGKKPAITGNLAMGTVNLLPYLGQSQQTGFMPSLISQAYAQTAAWNTTPIDLSALSALNATLDLKADSLVLPQITLPSPHIALSLNNATLKATLHEIVLFGGKIAGELGVYANSTTPRLTKRVVLQQVNMATLLSELYDYNKFTGTANGTVDIATTGSSQQQWMNNLSGTGTIAVTDGEITGVNLVEMVRNIRASFNPDALERSPVTAFSSLTSSLAINQGVVSTNDLLLTSRKYEILGNGSVNLPQKTINMRFTPKRVKKADSEEMVEGVKPGLTVPVVATGPFHAIKFRADLKDVATQALKDPKAAEDTIRELRDEFKGFRDDLGGQIKDVFKSFKKPKDAAPTPAPDTANPAPETSTPESAPATP